MLHGAWLILSTVTLFAHFVWNAAILAADLITHGDFSVNAQSVLDLGAGAGLPGIVACFRGAKTVVLSDYESPKLLANLQANVDENVPANLRSKVFVQSHIWGLSPEKITK
jgi:EEF1A N-terminal glycine/lysine methyltransferase